MRPAGVFSVSAIRIRLDAVVTHLVLIAATLVIQGCIQDSPPSTPPQVSDSLVLFLADQDWVVRRTAAEALGKIGDSTKVANLLLALSDASPDVREAAARALGRLDPIGTEGGLHLTHLLMDPSPAVRKAAAQSLSTIEVGQDVVSAIVASLSNANVEVRAAAAAALLGLEITGGDEDVLWTAADGEAAIRQTAVAVLGDQTDARGVEMLLDRIRHDVNAGVRAEAAYRLGFHAESRVMLALEAAANLDSSAQVRRWAQLSLAGLRR